ncbi:hypothetical protein BI49514_00317 [Brevibacterium iodinum ATCC 49514]|uniref:TrbL/VirB6 plasmid conjugal transfer protein n=2 Tax=Brevibacterium TaxID=1696 RepID=A0A2H1HV60_9MICO|nr:hypothetical protein [Brevibacterium iodinum]SMX66772.1 hypothetical protein BI49514_00317 [Brevibacterium iodinum ATCC 49514]SUW13601.1 Uncharacterised protein [Brevibacterium iodinum]
MKDNIAATVQNICSPNDVPQPSTYTNIDTAAGLNKAEPREGYRSTIKPDFTQDEAGGQGGNGMERLQRVYGDQGDKDDVIVKPTYERYGFSTLQWHSYGNEECMTPALVISPLANMSLMSMVHVPMMISMAFLNFVMDNVLYTGFSALMQPFIGAMYEIFEPWIYVLVPIGIFITWLASRHSLQATLKAGGWGVFIMSVYLLMGESTSQVVSWGTNIVTEVSGSAACKMNAAANGGQEDGEDCDADDPVKAVQEALWYGVPYQTWHLGQVGEHQAQLDDEALDKGEVGWGPALLNGQYVGVDEEGEIDETGKKVLQATSTWNSATYSPDGDESKNLKWGKDNLWDKVPYLANVKIMCDDRDNGDDTPGDDDNAMRRWMYNGASGTSHCDSAGAGTADMIPYITGDQYNKQILIAVSGLVGVTAVSLTIVGSAIYLGFQKMMFFFLLFLAPVVLLVSSLGDRKRRPFAVRYAEIVGVNLLKQVAAVCIVLFVSYAMASLFGSSTFGHIPWIMKPHAALLFFLALAFLAFPLKNMVKGAIQGDTSVIDKQATAPQRAMKKTASGVGKLAIAGGAIAATGGAAAVLGAGAGGLGAVGAGGKAAMVGKAGSMLGQAGRVMGVGSKAGRAMRGAGRLMQAGRGIMDAKDTKRGWDKGREQAAAEMIEKNPSRYHKVNEDGTLGGLLPGAQQKALKDAQSTAERGVKNQRAQQAQDDFMRKFFAGWGGPEAPRHQEPDDTTDPKPDPNPEPQPLPSPKPGARGALGSGDSGNGSQSSGSEQAQAPSGGPPSQGPSPQDTGGSDERPSVIDYPRFVEKARENLAGPEFSREMDYNVSTVRSGDDVLHNSELTKQQVLDDPTVLLSGSAYDGGRTTAMDPFHAATGALNELRFAGGSGNEADIESAVAKAVSAIDRHGVPDQIGGVHSIGDRATRFDPAEIIGAMPRLGTDATWQERAEAAHIMQAAQVALPANVPIEIRENLAEYTSQLSRPGADLGGLADQKFDLIEQISWWTQRFDLQAAYDAPLTAGVSRDDIREAVADGVRGAQVPTEATNRTSTWDQGTSASADTAAPATTEMDESDSGALIYRPNTDRRKRRRSGDDDTTEEM